MSGSTSVFNQPKPVVTLDPKLLEAITNAAEPYPIPEGRKYEYGTAGVGRLPPQSYGKANEIPVPHESVSFASSATRFRENMLTRSITVH